MGWSTRELAELGGTTLRAVRHYHAQGLLDEPERLANGYKAYRTEHLVRLLQIRRLTALGLSLKQITAINAGIPSEYGEALEIADQELQEGISRLEKARAELAEFRRLSAPADLPPRLSAAANAARISQSDRALYAVLAQLYGDESADNWQQIMEASTHDEATREFDQLDDNASEATRDRIAARFAEQSGTFPVPELNAAYNPNTAAATVFDVLMDMYSPAQLDVLERMWRRMGVL